MLYRYKKETFVLCRGKRSGAGAGIVGMTSEADKIFLEKAGYLNDGRPCEMGPISLSEPI